MSLLEFVLGSFWHFAGAVVLIGTVLNGIASIVSATSRRRKPRPWGPVIDHGPATITTADHKPLTPEQQRAIVETLKDARARGMIRY